MFKQIITTTTLVASSMLCINAFAADYTVADGQRKNIQEIKNGGVTNASGTTDTVTTALGQIFVRGPQSGDNNGQVWLNAVLNGSGYNNDSGAEVQASIRLNSGTAANQICDWKGTITIGGGATANIWSTGSNGIISGAISGASSSTLVFVGRNASNSRGTTIKGAVGIGNLQIASTGVGDTKNTLVFDTGANTVNIQNDFSAISGSGVEIRTGARVTVGGDAYFGGTFLNNGTFVCNGEFTNDVGENAATIGNVELGTAGKIIFDFTGKTIVAGVKQLLSASSIVASGNVVDRFEVAGVDATQWAHVFAYDNDAKTASITFTVAIPEPSMFGLLAGLGALALVGARRRRK